MSEDFDDEFIEGLRVEFCNEAVTSLQTIESIVIGMEKSKDIGTVDELKRLLHSLKGSSRAVGFEAFSACAHEIENICMDTNMLDHIDQILRSLDRMAAAVQEFLQSNDATGMLNFSAD